MKKIKTYLILHFAILIYSLSNIASKKASGESILSFNFIFYVGLLVLCLGIYAILWQQVLKDMDLTIAYANKGIAVIWSLLITYFMFNDEITVFNIMGCILVAIGVAVMAFGDAKHE